MRRGVIRQVSGSVIDVEFEPAYLPRLQEALTVTLDGKTLTMETAQHIGNNRVRCIMLAASEDWRGVCRLLLQAVGFGCR